MGGIEILVEDTFPYDLKNFLPVPPTSMISRVGQAPTVIIRYHFLILWIVGVKKTESIENFIQDIQNSPNFIKSSTNTDAVHQLIVVNTTEQATQWIKSNRELIRKKEIIFKVVTLWKIQDDKTAIDVIRAVRSELSRVPVLIYTNKQENTQAALEFPNVLATDMEYELKEFVGVKQETQWNAGCRVAHEQNPKTDTGK
jgi:hypothetical protein